ncbi:MAG: 2-amino-4-hydroxy-6-hydroxymethyldihydropteridine diphosphokinase [Gammaproteobacteria bacterium]|nr:2-amino-4-hydroxy-6-hydroxymethyldihydropteridine diphosphokinase [Gammaproteobacteria bacterium]
MTRVLIALGSNLGDRAGHVRAAMEALEKIAAGPVTASSIYYTDPQDMEDDAEGFANAAASFDTGLSAHELLAALQEIEVAMGRPPDHGHNASRTIDLDIITYGEARIADEHLEVPHPRAQERRFVLMPLVEIAPDADIGGRPARDCLALLLG